MKKIYLVIIILFLFNTFVSIHTKEKNKNLSKVKVFISQFEYSSDNKSYTFFKKAIARSIRISLKRRGFTVIYNDKDKDSDDLQGDGFEYKVAGKYFIRKNVLIVRFSVIDVKEDNSILQASVRGYPDNRVFDLVDTLTTKVKAEILQSSPKDKKMFKITRINRQGKLTSEQIKLDNNKRLQNRDLSGMNLRGKKVTNSNLSRSNLSESDLRDADFKNTNLKNANLKKTKFNNANFKNAKLNNADMSGSDLSKANFENADLRGVNFKGATFNKTNFRNADFRGVDLNGVNIKNSDFTGATFKYKNDHKKGIKVKEKQGFNFRVGVNIAVGLSRQSSAVLEDSNLNVNFCGVLTVRMFLYFNKNVGILVDLGYMNFITKENKDDGSQISVDMHYIFGLFAPVFRFHNINTYFGLYIGVPISFKYDAKSTFIDGTDKATRPVYGLGLGIGYLWDLGRVFALHFGFDFKYHLINPLPNAGLSSKPFSILLSVGVLFQ